MMLVVGQQGKLDRIDFGGFWRRLLGRYRNGAMFDMLTTGGWWVDIDVDYDTMGDRIVHSITEYDAEGSIISVKNILEEEQQQEAGAVLSSSAGGFSDGGPIPDEEPRAHYGKTETFTYDDIGNRKQLKTNYGLGLTSTDDYTTNDLNQYTETTDPCGTFSYDSAGNMTLNRYGPIYHYDYENRLIKITEDPNTADPNDAIITVAEFDYDALGRRVRVQDVVGNETTHYYYDTQYRVITEHDGTLARMFVYGNGVDEPLAMYVPAHGQRDTSGDPNDMIWLWEFAETWLCDANDTDYNSDYDFNNDDFVDLSDYSEIADDWTYRPEDLGTPEQRYYYLKDALGSVMGLIGTHEDATPEFHLYYAYGNSNSTSVQDNPYHFTARRMDKFDGTPYIQFNRHRYYDSDIGRWLTPDPLGIVPNGWMGNQRFGPSSQYTDGVNLYAYVRCSPSNMIDSHGLRRCSVGFWGDDRHNRAFTYRQGRLSDQDNELSYSSNWFSARGRLRLRHLYQNMKREGCCCLNLVTIYDHGRKNKQRFRNKDRTPADQRNYIPLPRYFSAYYTRKLCPFLCPNATIWLTGCKVGSSEEAFFQSIFNACHRVKYIKACLGKVKTKARFGWHYYLYDDCPEGWKTRMRHWTMR